MICFNCREPLNSSYTICPICGARQPYVSEEPSFTQQFSSEMGEAVGGAAKVIIVVAMIAIFLPILLFNPITIYYCLYRKRIFPKLYKYSRIFIFISSILFTISSIGILAIGLNSVYETKDSIINLFSTLGRYSVNFILISLFLLAIARLMEKRSGISKIVFIFLIGIFSITVPLSTNILKTYFDFPVNGETRLSKDQDRIAQEKKIEQDKIEEIRSIPMTTENVIKHLEDSGYMVNTLTGMAGTTFKISDTHFRINSKSNSANTADIFMLPEDSESLEFKQLLSDFKISNSYAQPGEWYISYDFPSGNPSPVNRVTSLDKLPNKF